MYLRKRKLNRTQLRPAVTDKIIYEDDVLKRRMFHVSKKYFFNKLKKYYTNVSRASYNQYWKKYKTMVFCRLEQRLDTCIYRVKWASTLSYSRQLINHGHICINGRIATSSAMVVQTGDLIQVVPHAHTQVVNHIQKQLHTVTIPKYYEVNFRLLAAILLYVPVFKEIPYATIKQIY